MAIKNMLQQGAIAWGKQQKQAFTPYSPVVPAGSYDPGLDAALGATQRGGVDTQAAIQTARERATQDYGITTAGINRDYTRGTEDLTTVRNRGTEDLTTARDRGMEGYDTQGARGKEDYERNVAMLQRQYELLGGQQRQAAQSRGVAHGGALLQAAGKRAANEALERQPLDTGFKRLGEDISTGRRYLGEDYSRGTTRLGEDFTRGTTRLGEDKDTALGTAGLQYLRGDTDFTTQSGIASRETAQFGIDTNTQKLFQASQAGYVAPTKPSNEFTSPGGTPYKVITGSGGSRYYIDQYGRRLASRPA